METTPQPRRRNTRSDLVHLRSLPSSVPRTNAGKVVAAWVEIEAGLARGMKLREVWEAATLDGLQIPYPQFRVYVSRTRRRLKSVSGPVPQPPQQQETAPLIDHVAPAHDPFRNLREQREKKKSVQFDYEPFSINKSLTE